MRCVAEVFVGIRSSVAPSSIELRCTCSDNEGETKERIILVQRLSYCICTLIFKL